MNGPQWYTYKVNVAPYAKGRRRGGLLHAHEVFLVDLREDFAFATRIAFDVAYDESAPECAEESLIRFLGPDAPTWDQIPSDRIESMGEDRKRPLDVIALVPREDEETQEEWEARIPGAIEELWQTGSISW